MKYIKKFNEEISSRLYYRVSNKLKKLGHTKRADVMKKWAEQVENKEEIEKWKQNIEECKEFGTYSVKISPLSSEAIIGDFYLSITMDADGLAENIECLVAEDPDNFEGSIVLFIGLIPVDQETLDRCLELLPDPDMNNGFFWGMIVSIDFIISAGNFKFKDNAIDSYDSGAVGVTSFNSRKDANTFKNVLYKIFSEEIDCPSGYTDITNLYDKMFQTLSNVNFITDYGFSMDMVASFIKSYPVNKLYKQ